MNISLDVFSIHSENQPPADMSYYIKPTVFQIVGSLVPRSMPHRLSVGACLNFLQIYFNTVYIACMYSFYTLCSSSSYRWLRRFQYKCNMHRFNFYAPFQCYFYWNLIIFYYHQMCKHKGNEYICNS